MSANLVLGPVLFNWPPEALRDFYFRVADEAAVDTVHVGEVVCAKRMPFLAPHLPAIVDRLRAGGKEVVLSSLALLAADRDVEAMAALFETDCLVEVNDLGLLRAAHRRPHVIGPFVNVYNEDTLAYLAGRGAVRACLPPELPAATLAALARTTPTPLEVMVFGRMPLAISARCFHARAHHLHKDGCQFVCGKDADGLTIRTLDAMAFLAINGTQTLSHTCLNLMAELAALRQMGITRYRLSPHSVDMVAVARLFRDIVDGRMSPVEGTAMLRNLTPEMPFSNGFFHDVAGLAYHREQHLGRV